MRLESHLRVRRGGLRVGVGEPPGTGERSAASVLDRSLYLCSLDSDHFCLPLLGDTLSPLPEAADLTNVEKIAQNKQAASLGTERQERPGEQTRFPSNVPPDSQSPLICW